ncbi:MAG: phosphatidate cytidylyltransferase [Bacteroidota bacterium]
MNTDIIHTALLATAFLLLFGVAELLYHKLGVKAELTRKLVHSGTGLLTLLFPLLLSSHWHVLFLCASFALILMASLRFDLLRSINAIDRRSHGSISYPVAVYGCFLVFEHNHRELVYFYLPILTLAICDPMAALFGKRFPYGRFRIGKDSKTLVGVSAFFVSSLLLTVPLLFFLSVTEPDWMAIWRLAALTALFSSVTEAVSGKGLDNITIPASVILILTLFL